MESKPTLELFDNYINGLARHYQYLGKGQADRASERYTLEYCAEGIYGWIAERETSAYQRGITDALNSLPAPSQRSATSLGPDTLNKDYQRGNFDGYNEYYSQAKKNLTKLKEGE